MKRIFLIVLCFLSLLPAQGQLNQALLGAAHRRNAAVGPALVASTGKAGGSTSVTSDAIDTTGANFIVLSVLYNGVTGTLTDSKGNTWTALAEYGTPRISKIYYCYAPSVGSGHTFTATTFGNPGIQVLAFSGIASSPLDVENGAANANTTTYQPGPITTTVSNTLSIAFMGREGIASDLSIDSGYTIGNSTAGAFATSYGSGSAYRVLTATSTENPTFTVSVTVNVFGSMAAFKY